ILRTSIPTVPAADGFSPDARRRRPQRVRNSMEGRKNIRKIVKYRYGVPENSNGPRIGMLLRTGTWIASIVGGVFSSVFLDKTRRNRKLVIPSAPMLMTTPAMIWSTL